MYRSYGHWKDHLFSIVNAVHLLKLRESCKNCIHLCAVQIFQFKQIAFDMYHFKKIFVLVINLRAREHTQNTDILTNTSEMQVIVRETTEINNHIHFFSFCERMNMHTHSRYTPEQIYQAMRRWFWRVVGIMFGSQWARTNTHTLHIVGNAWK